MVGVTGRSINNEVKRYFSKISLITVCIIQRTPWTQGDLLGKMMIRVLCTVQKLPWSSKRYSV